MHFQQGINKKERSNFNEKASSTFNNFSYFI
jgi:hypothetical protein